MSVAVEAIKAGATNYLVRRSLSREVLVNAIQKALPGRGVDKTDSLGFRAVAE